MNDTIEYFVQITTAVQVPGGVSYRSFVDYLDVKYTPDAGRRFWEIASQANAELERTTGHGFEFENGAALIFYRAVPNE